MSLISLALLSASSVAHAQDARASSDAGDTEVREIVRGFFLKSNIGSTLFLGVTAPAGLLSGVMTVQIGAGQDFIDKERFSAAWEIDIAQGLFNGPRTEDLAGLPPLIEGDIHAYQALAGVEVSTYITRRVSIGVRGGGGVMYAPLLMHPDEYNATVVAAWGGVPASVHEGPLPVVYGGPSLEYYTKLSHFSVGVEADVAFVIGLDLGISPTGYLKYTF
jgi:hypothetical protein